MKLIVKGKVVLLGRGAKFENAYVNFPSLLGTKLAQPVNDTYLEVTDIEKDALTFRYAYFDSVEEFTLHPGEKAEFRKEGNAFLLEVAFSLVETKGK